MLLKKPSTEKNKFKIFPLCNLYHTLNTGLKSYKTLPLLLSKIVNHNGLSYQIHLDLHNWF